MAYWRRLARELVGRRWQLHHSQMGIVGDIVELGLSAGAAAAVAAPSDGRAPVSVSL